MKSFIIAYVVCWGIIPVCLAIWSSIACKISMDKLDKLIDKIKGLESYESILLLDSQSDRCAECGVWKPDNHKDCIVLKAEKFIKEHI